MSTLESGHSPAHALAHSTEHWPAHAAIELCLGRVMHKRFKPVVHPFSYGVFFLRVPVSKIDNIGGIPRNIFFSKDKFNLLSFMTRDFGPRDGGSLELWIRALLAREGIHAADGEVILQAFPRVLGYVFNPISVWYCFDRTGGLRAALCEVNNTFGERHNYLLVHDDQRVMQASDWFTARKVFHVSPFCEVKGHYRFRFEQIDDRAFTQIDYHDEPIGNAGAETIPHSRRSAGNEDALLITTTIFGKPQPLTSRATLSAFFSYPLMTFGVMARIHWQALKLWLKHVPFISKPAPPTIETTR